MLGDELERRTKVEEEQRWMAVAERGKQSRGGVQFFN